MITYLVRRPQNSPFVLTALGLEIEANTTYDLVQEGGFNLAELQVDTELEQAILNGDLEYLETVGGPAVSPQQAVLLRVAEHFHPELPSQAQKDALDGVSNLGASNPVVGRDVFDGHVNDQANPHNVTAAQAGAAPVGHGHPELPTADQKAALDAAGPVNAANPYVAQNTLDAHVNDQNNPHGVTAAQAGAAPVSHTHVASEITDFDTAVAAAPAVQANTTHAGQTDNPHNVTPAQIGAAATNHTHVAADVTDFDDAVAQAPSVQANTNHAANTSNPHGTTAAQVGAIPATEKGAANGVATLDGSGAVPDAQIPAAIARDSELQAHVSDQTNPHNVTATQAGAIPTSEKGMANGVATLNASGKVPASQLDIASGLVPGGTWNAATNTPTLASGVGVENTYYVVSTAGTTNLDGITDWQPKDWALFSGGVWQKIDNTDQVTSVQGQQGAVFLDSDDLPEGSGNLYFSNARVAAAPAVVANTNHAAATNNPHGTTAAQVGAIPTSEKGVANGVASLDASGDVPDAQIPASIARDSELSAHTTNTSNPHNTSIANVVPGTLAQLNSRITDGNLDLAGTPRPPTTHTHTASQITDFAAATAATAAVSNNTAHRQNTNNPHNTTKAQVGLGNVQNILHNLVATADPLPTNDSSQGYSRGSRWVTATAEWVCHNAATGSAVWLVTTNSGSSGQTTPVKLFEGSHAATLSIPEAWTDVPISVEHFKDSPFVHSGSSAEVTINELGRYAVRCDVQFDSNVNNRVFYGIRILVDTGSGFQVVARSERQGGYARNTAIDETKLDTECTVEITAVGHKIKVQVQREAASSNGTTNLTRATLTISKAEGQQGDTGPAGPPGLTTLDVRGDGSSVGTAFSALNFAGFPAVQNVGGVATVQAPLGGSANKTNYYYFDHFDAYRFWAGVVWVSNYNVTLADALGGQARLNFGLLQSGGMFSVAARMRCEWRFKLDDSPTDVQIGFRSGADNRAALYLTSSGNWKAVTSTSASNRTDTTTSVARDTNWHIFAVESDGGSVIFSVDGIVVATHTADLPLGILDCYMLVSGAEGFADWVEMQGDLET